MRNVAIILAGGRGTRMGADVPKQFVRVLGRPVLSYTIERFQRHPEVDIIEVVCRDGWKDEIDDICLKGDFSKVRWVAPGGTTPGRWSLRVRPNAPCEIRSLGRFLRSLPSTPPDRRPR